MLAVTHVANGSQEMIWLKTAACQEADGGPHWIVTDIIVLPLLEDIRVADYCVGADGGHRFLIALGELDTSTEPEASPGSPFTRILMAWTIDATEDRFVPIFPEGLECYIDYGPGGDI